FTIKACTKNSFKLKSEFHFVLFLALAVMYKRRSYQGLYQEPPNYAVRPASKQHHSSDIYSSDSESSSSDDDWLQYNLADGIKAKHQNSVALRQQKPANKNPIRQKK